jgi:hypothetical protein
MVACRLAKRLVRWTLNVRDPVATFVRGRAVATGDAAHPQLPREYPR